MLNNSKSDKLNYVSFIRLHMMDLILSEISYKILIFKVSFFAN